MNKTIKTFYPTEEIDSNNFYHKFVSIIPGFLGINLSSLDGIEEKKNENGKLISLTLKFKTDNK